MEERVFPTNSAKAIGHPWARNKEKKEIALNLIT